MGNDVFIGKVLDRASAAIDPAEAIAAVSDPGFGGIDVFIGKVRDLNQGRAVRGITYDLFEPLVLNEIQRLAAEIEATFGPKLKLYVAHAKGRLGMLDYGKVFNPVQKNGPNIFDLRGINREQGALVVVRPDQYIAHVLPLNEHKALAAFFDGFMIA